MKWPKHPKLTVNANYVKSYNSMREEVRQGVSPLPSDGSLRHTGGASGKIMLPWRVVKPVRLKPNTQIGGPRPRAKH